MRTDDKGIHRRLPVHDAEGEVDGIRLALFGTLLSIALLAGLSTAGPARATTTFVVRNTKDSGPDSLRAAILAANASPDRDTIKLGSSAGLWLNLPEGFLR